jgi:hypothetical protein
MAYRLFDGRDPRDEGRMLPAKDGSAFVFATILRLSWVLTVTILLLAVDARAQASTVIGTIKYGNGKPAVNVLVSIGDNYRYTDVGGRYKITGVPHGKQHMRIRIGQKLLWQGDVDISGAITTVDRVLP